MRNKTLKLGVAAAATLMLSLGYVSPAFAESGTTLDGGSGSEVTPQQKDAEVSRLQPLAAPQGLGAEPERVELEDDGTAARIVSGSFGGVKITAIPLLFSPAGAGTTYKTTKVTFNGPALINKGNSHIYYSM